MPNFCQPWERSLSKTLWEKAKKLETSIFSFNPFPNKPWFSRVCSKLLLKTLWEKEKSLVTSNFSFSHSVFNHFRELSAIFIKFDIVVCKLFQFGRVQNLSFGKGLTTMFSTLPNSNFTISFTFILLSAKFDAFNLVRSTILSFGKELIKSTWNAWSQSILATFITKVEIKKKNFDSCTSWQWYHFSSIILSRLNTFQNDTFLDSSILKEFADDNVKFHKNGGKLWVISPFTTVFSKDLYCKHVKNRACLGKS